MSEKNLDWAGIKTMLARLRDIAPAALNGSVLVGGAACWAYRMALSSAGDPDFKVPQWSAAEEKLWLSKDIDFTNAMPLDIPDDDQLRIGYVQFGVRLGPEDFMDTAKPLKVEAGTGEPFTILIADPLDLYREKQATAARRGLPADQLHVQLLREFLKLDLVRAGEAAAKESGALARWSQVSSRSRAYAPEILVDERVERRLKAIGNLGLIHGLLFG